MRRIRKNNQYSDIIIGFLVGAITNVLGVVLWWGIFSRIDIQIYFKNLYTDGNLGKVISLGALLSLGAFFLFLRRSFDIRARGVLLWVFVVAFLTMYLEFFT